MPIFETHLDLSSTFIGLWGTISESHLRVCICWDDWVFLVTAIWIFLEGELFFNLYPSLSSTFH